MAYRRGTIIDTFLTIFASVMTSIPNYLVAILLFVFVGVQWHGFRSTPCGFALLRRRAGLYLWEFFSDALYHAAVPMFTYFITTIGQWMLSMKSSTMSTLEEDYVNVATGERLPRPARSSSHTSGETPPCRLYTHRYADRFCRRRGAAHRDLFRLSRRRQTLDRQYQPAGITP